jgi:hypothetical protein
MNKNLEELESLLFDWEAGTLDDGGVQRVRAILRSDEEARTHFVRLQMISAALTLESDAGLGLPALDEPNSSRSRKTLVDPATALEGPATLATATSARASTYRWIFAAAALLICVLAGRIVYLEFASESGRSPELVGTDDGQSRDMSQEATSQGVALITRLVNVDWSDGQTPLEVGDALSPGRLAIQSGYAQIEFFCGATVILEGPAELALESATLTRVHSGRLRAQVPPAARGFSIEVGDMKVVDLGTEFGLSVSPEGTDVQVFDGEVELHQPSKEKRRLTAGQAMARNAEGSYEKTEVTPERFVDIAGLESRAEDQQHARFERWEKWSQQLRRDPRLIAYYAFDRDESWERKLNSSLEPTNSELDGAVVGARRVRGRWQSKGGLDFKRPGDRVRVQIPGEYSSLTFACWVKIDSLDRWYNSLFLTDNYNKGEPHWQILDSGQLFFSVRVKGDGDKGPEHREVLSPAFWTPSLSGKWLCLATTYDVDAKRVTHYLNGELLHRETIPEFQLVRTTRFGRATIGNWSSPQRPDAHFAIRNLNGSMDEFALFSAALTGEEIKEMYDNGKP